MEIREGLYYSKDHEWVRVEGNRAYVGITDYAQDSLGSIVYVELPTVGKELSKGDALGVVESVKAASDIFSPISGTVVEVNQTLVDNPELINENPYENYIAVLCFENTDELNELLSPAQYKELTEGE